MRLSLLMVIKAVITMVFGIAFLAVPTQTLDIYALELNDAGILMTRLLGAAFVVIGVLLWFARHDTGSEALRAIIYGVFVGDFVGFLVMLWAALDGPGNAFAWINVAIYLLLSLGFGYFVLNAPEPRPHAAA